MHKDKVHVVWLVFLQAQFKHSVLRDFSMSLIEKIILKFRINIKCSAREYGYIVHNIHVTYSPPPYQRILFFTPKIKNRKAKEFFFRVKLVNCASACRTATLPSFTTSFFLRVHQVQTWKYRLEK